MGEARIIDKIMAIGANKKLIVPLSLIGLAIVGSTAIYTINRNATQQKSKEPIAPAPAITAVTALGRLEPKGEVIQLSPPPDLGGNKIAQLLVTEGDRVIIIVLRQRWNWHGRR